MQFLRVHHQQSLSPVPPPLPGSVTACCGFSSRRDGQPRLPRQDKTGPLPLEPSVLAPTGPRADMRRETAHVQLLSPRPPLSVSTGPCALGTWDPWPLPGSAHLSPSGQVRERPWEGQNYEKSNSRSETVGGSTRACLKAGHQEHLSLPESSLQAFE